MTDSAISGPIPSPGKRVARIGVEAEEKTLEVADEGDDKHGREERIWLERLPRARLSRWEAIDWLLKKDEDDDEKANNVRECSNQSFK